MQEGSIVRPGGKREVRVNARVVVATHRDLVQDVQRGSFRRDLYYRLHMIPIRPPSLRERLQDIRALPLHFLSCINQDNQDNQRTDA